MGESAELDQPLASIEKQPNDSEEFRAVSISPEKSIFGCDDEFVEYWDEIPENTIDKDDSAGKSTKQSIPTKSLSFISSGFGSCESHQSQHSTISKCALPSTVVKMDRSQSSISDFSSESNTQPNEMVQEAAKLDAKEIEAFKSILQDLV